MIPILYEANETEFRSNGIGRLVDCLRLEVTEERNGIFELEFDYPITGQHYADIVEGRIIASIHDDQKDVQPFDIYSRSAPIDGIVTFYAHHISYRLQYSILRPFTASSCAAAFAVMADECVTPCPFTFWTDKTTAGSFTVSAPVSVKEILGGVQGSILDVYGKAEYEWDKFAVKLHLNRGQSSGVQIRYGKNLVDLTQDVDTSGFHSAVVPYWLGGDDSDTLVTLPEWVVLSSAAQAGSVPVNAVPLDLSDQWEEAPTVDQLRTRAQKRLEDSEAWLPNENVKVDFVALWQTEEYADIAPLERVRLCDRVDVIYSELGLVAKNVQVIKVVYDGLLERYISMELGTARTSFADVVQAAAEAAILPQVPTKSFLQAAIDQLSAEINAGTGGIIVDVKDANGNRTEVLILCDEGVTADTPPEQCQHIWRINKAGIGYSSDYGRTYSLAITASGQIVADFITTGTMMANIIKGGTLTLGGSNNGNGVLAVNNASGDEIGRIDNSGAAITGQLIMETDSAKVHAGIFTFDVFDEFHGQVREKTLPGFRILSKQNPNIEMIFALGGGSVRQIVKQDHFNDYNDVYGGIWDIQRYFQSVDGSNIVDWYVREVTYWKYEKRFSTPDYKDNAKFQYGGDGQNFNYYSHSLDGAGTTSLTIGQNAIRLFGRNANSDSVNIDVNSQGAVIGYESGDGAVTHGLHLYPNTSGFTANGAHNANNESHELSNTPYLFSAVGASFSRAHELSVLYNQAKISYSDSGNVVYEFIVNKSGATLNGSAIALVSTSSARYKHSISTLQDDELNPHRLYDLPVKQFVYNYGHPIQYRDMAGKTLPGFIAEDVAEVYPSAAIHNGYGQVESWDERRIIPGMLALLQEQHQQIKALTEKVEHLERLVKSHVG